MSNDLVEYCYFYDGSDKDLVQFTRLCLTADLDKPYDGALQKLHGCVALALCAAWNRLDMVNLLLTHGAPPDGTLSQGHTALMLLAQVCDSVRPNLAIPSLLLKFGASINIQDDDGWTALHYAAKRKAYKFIEFLLDHGADPTIKNAAGKMPIDCCGDQRCRELLAGGGSGTKAAKTRK